MWYAPIDGYICRFTAGCTAIVSGSANGGISERVREVEFMLNAYQTDAETLRYRDLGTERVDWERIENQVGFVSE